MLFSKSKKNKYQNQLIKKDGIRYQSKKEYSRFLDLKEQEKSGEISGLTLKPTFILLENFTDRDGKKHRSIKMVPDFMYIKDGVTIVEDVKGSQFLTKRMYDYQIKKKLLLCKYPDIKFEEYY